MTANTRRTFLTVLLGVGAAGGRRGLMAPLHAAQSLAPVLRLPDTAMRLKRKLERGVGESAAISARRVSAIRFDRQGRGSS